MKPYTTYQVLQGGNFSILILNADNGVLNLSGLDYISPGDVFVTETTLTQVELHALLTRAENHWWQQIAGANYSGVFRIIREDGSIGLFFNKQRLPLDQYLKEL